ncbi:MAG: hypothetical protein V4616_09720 [Bacteroidota bacterium]
MSCRSLFTSLATVVAISVFGQVPSQWTSHGVGGGGALFAPSINPADHAEFYVACDMSELFHTRNFGNSYQTEDFKKIQGGAHAEVQFSKVTGTMYSIDHTSGAPGYVPVPVKTTNGGQSWSPLPGNPDNSEEIYSIHTDYNNPDRVLIAQYGSLFFSSNGGITFTNIRNAANSGSGLHIAGAFFDGNTIYVGTNDGLLVSTNGGSTFSMSSITGIPAAQGMFSFAGAKAGGVTRLVCLTGNKTDIYVGKPGNEYEDFVKGVYTLDYGSGNWVSKVNGMNLSSDFMMFVRMAETNTDTIYLAGSRNSEPGVLRSVTGGGNWTSVFNSAGNQNIATGWSGSGGDRGWSYGECAFGFTVAKNDPNKLIITDFGFVHVSANAGADWNQAYVQRSDEHPTGSATPKGRDYHSSGLENTTCWQLAWADSSTMMACFSDIRGIRSTDAGSTFNFNYTGHSANSMYRIARHANGTLYAGTSGIHDMYQSTRLADAQLDANDTQGKIIYSINKGADWQNLKVFNHPVFWLAIDPGNAERMYASVIHSSQGGIYVTQNLSAGSASVWTKLPNPPRTQGHPATIEVLKDGKVVVTYSGRRAPSFTSSSGCFLYDPAAGTWTDVSHSGMYYWTKDVVIDPSDPLQNTWYVCVFSGWGGAANGLGGLYRTTNRGGSWTKLTGTMFDRVTSITFNPGNSSQAWLTTEVDGLFITDNIGAATPSWSQVEDYLFRQPERVFYNPYNPREVWVTSFGNGLQKGTVPQFTIQSAAHGSGSISPSGTKTVFSGDTVSYTFVASPGSQLDSLIVDSVVVPGATTSYEFQNIARDHRIDAYFSAVTYVISASSGLNGSITPTGEQVVPAGDSISFSISTDPGYHIDSVLIDSVYTGTASAYTFFSVASDHTIRAVFAADVLPTYTISASAGPGGTSTPLGTITVTEGDSVRFSFQADPGYHQDSLFVDGIFAGMPGAYTFYDVHTDHTLHVTFAADSQPALVVHAIAGAGGTISPSGTFEVAPGDSITFTLLADPGFQIDSLLVNDEFEGVPAVFVFKPVLPENTVRAVFKAIPSGIKETQAHQWQLYPNPANDWVYLVFTTVPLNNFGVQLSTIDGRTAADLEGRHHLAGNTVSLDLRELNLEKGTYLIAVWEDGRFHTAILQLER